MCTVNIWPETSVCWLGLGQNIRTEWLYFVIMKSKKESKILKWHNFQFFNDKFIIIYLVLSGRSLILAPFE